jgi:hypothetical protein
VAKQEKRKKKNKFEGGIFRELFYIQRRIKERRKKERKKRRKQFYKQQIPTLNSSFHREREKYNRQIF